jgi:hypothetical protein
MLVVESARVSHLEDKLAKCKSDYANLEATAAEAERLHTEILSVAEAKYTSRVSPLEGEL